MLELWSFNWIMLFDTISSERTTEIYFELISPLFPCIDFPDVTISPHDDDPRLLNVYYHKIFCHYAGEPEYERYKIGEIVPTVDVHPRTYEITVSKNVFAEMRFNDKITFTDAMSFATSEDLLDEICSLRSLERFVVREFYGPIRFLV